MSKCMMTFCLSSKNVLNDGSGSHLFSNSPRVSPIIWLIFAVFVVNLCSFSAKPRALLGGCAAGSTGSLSDGLNSSSNVLLQRGEHKQKIEAKKVGFTRTR